MSCKQVKHNVPHKSHTSHICTCCIQGLIQCTIQLSRTSCARLSHTSAPQKPNAMSHASVTRKCHTQTPHTHVTCKCHIPASRARSHTNATCKCHPHMPHTASLTQVTYKSHKRHTAMSHAMSHTHVMHTWYIQLSRVNVPYGCPYNVPCKHQGQMPHANATYTCHATYYIQLL